MFIVSYCPLVRGVSDLLGHIGNKPLHALLQAFASLGRAWLQVPHSIPDVDQAHRIRNLMARTRHHCQHARPRAVDPHEPLS